MYQYKAYTWDKRIVESTVNALTADAAEEELYRAGYARVLTIEKITPPFSLKRLLTSANPVTTENTVEFLRQLATLLGSTMSIVTALQQLETQTPATAMKEIISGLRYQLTGGKSFSEALSAYPQFISEAYRQVLRSSEQSGRLNEGMKMVADYIERETTLGKKVTRILAYPTFLFIMAAIVTGVIATVAFPPLVTVFESFGVPLPLATRIFVSIAGFLAGYGFVMVGVIAALLLGAVIYARSPAGKAGFESLLLRLPQLGAILTLRSVSRFCRMSAMLLNAGMTLPHSIRTIAAATGSTTFNQELWRIERELVQGKGLAQPMQAGGVFPRLLVDMVIIGEKTGTLGANLETMAGYYEQRLEQKTQKVLAGIEPASIIIVGLVVSFIGIAIMTPLYSILNTMY